MLKRYTHCISSYPTYEEWKPVWKNYCNVFRASVLILPMRNGNYGKSITKTSKQPVLILPMRNGNPPFNALSASLMKSSSYPTYEEWKLLTRHTYKSNQICVLILPMRNGNTVSFENTVEYILFLSYL